MYRKEKLLTGLDPRALVGAEIGPLMSPHVTKAEGHILYIDHADTETLRAKYRSDPNVDVSRIVAVDAVWGDRTLSDCMDGVKVDYVLASHVIEHVPDLLTWLREIRSILKPGGALRLAVPDRRFSFDYVRRETSLADVLNAWLLKARAPLPICILDHVINACDVDAAAAWRGELRTADLRRHHDVAGAINLARDALAHGSYHDVHCWVFTPESFGRLFAAACRDGLIDFECDLFYDTEPGDLEFIVGLRPATDRDAMAQSWLRMAQGTPAIQR